MKIKIYRSKNVIKKSRKGITLIALIITIIVLLILAGVVLNAVLGDNGIFRLSKEAVFKNKMAEIAEEYSLYKAEAVLNSMAETDGSDIYAGELLKKIIQDEELEVEESKVQDIKKMLKKVTSKEEKYVIVHEGELYYVSQKNIENNENQTKWCEEIGIKIWEYTANTGIKVINGNYENVNGVYLCTPILNTGFVKEKTRYMKEDKNGKLIPSNWINKKPDDDWYDYKNKKWANIYVESSGLESYYVWIPRYVYKISTTENQRMDVKFVDINNNYKDGETDEVTSWEALQSQGYQIPEAFYFGDNDNYLENTPIPGYWISKYQLSDLTTNDTYMIDYSTTATPSTITIKNIVINTEKLEAEGKKVAKYTYAINGKILHESTLLEEYTIKGLAKGNKAVNVTMLDENGQVLGSMTKLYEVADINEPDLTGFDKDTTFYVYWDEKGIEHNEIPISMEPPAQWYDYGIQNWANIVTRNNGLETYFVWIPRYQYALDPTSQRTYVKFIKGTGQETDSGYQIPEAFSWGDNNEVQLSGYWISKYQLSEAQSTQKITAEITGGSNVIRVKDIQGEIVEDSLKYEYYLNGVKKHEGKDSKENYVYTGLEEGKTYTVNIIARNLSTDQYMGAITKKVELISVNKPDLTGFNKDRTYYVLYDEKGNMTIGDKIKNDGSNMPKDWYDYSDRRWANIVVTDGTIKNGQIENATTTSYFTWIPRYQYTLNTTTQRANVKFIKGTSTEVDNGGYKIPEAFSWGDNNEVQLKGYWMSKYQLSN